MLGIVILNYNNATQTLECLKSLYAHCTNKNGYRICVVDNSSRKEDLEALKQNCQEKILVSPNNLGYACGNNIGLEYFDKDPDINAILILNNDTLLTQDILTPMYSYLMSNDSCGVVFPLVLDKNGNIDPACMRRSKTTRDLILQATRLKCRRREFIDEAELKDKDGQWKTDRSGAIRTEVPPGSCMMLRKDVFKSAGWLDPHTFLYFEEHILSDKLQKLGLDSYLLPGISIIHLGAQTTAKQPSKAVYRHWRNSYLYYLKYFSKIPAPIRFFLRLRTIPKAL